MARCSAKKVSTVTNKTILVCDLTEGHLTAVPRHYDALEETDWLYNPYKPTAVPYTRTNPPKKPQRAAIKSASHITSQFEVVRG